MSYFGVIFVSSSTFVKLAVNMRLNFECVKVLHHRVNVFTIRSIHRSLASIVMNDDLCSPICPFTKLYFVPIII